MARQILQTSLGQLGLRLRGPCQPSFDRRQAFSTASRHSGILLHSVEVPDMSLSKQPHHVKYIAEQLKKNGILKVLLGFPDRNSQYLQQLLLGFHKDHGHRLPIAHSATRGWFVSRLSGFCIVSRQPHFFFEVRLSSIYRSDDVTDDLPQWDIHPTAVTFQSPSYQARSETMEQFPWHTDCSYEEQPPKYFALQVLHPDRRGGGTLSLLGVARLGTLLSPPTKAHLMRPEYQIETPPEFIKDPTRRRLVGSVLETGEGGPSDVLMRYRDDIVTPLGKEAAAALEELREVLRNESLLSTMVLRLGSADMPEGSILLVDNRRWLHSRTHVQDPRRHLRRVRWDADAFPGLA